MKRCKRSLFNRSIILCLILSFSWGCGAAIGFNSNPAPTMLRDFPPDALMLPQESERVEKGQNSGIDYGNASEGYIMAWYTGSKQAKIQVTKMESASEAQNPSWNYDVDDPVVKEVLPLQAGSGRYKVFVAEQLEDTRYLPLVLAEFDVVIENEFAPFLYATKYAMFSENSFSVQKAREVTQGCTSDIEALHKIYMYIKDTVAYDTQKAETIQSFYTPHPDITLAEGQGICLDYASLTCTMLRAVQIPTKLVTGRVSNDLSHAWNSVYLENEGWVDVKIYLSLHEWEVIDLTFAAGSINSAHLAQYIGTGDIYTELKTY
ncbi:MAG: transglutaminase-like domain-containing protein [Peptococcaceae bacterium]|nr:transglutaminase-like domain-containing protein [Peptococcaceae bacterium]